MRSTSIAESIAAAIVREATGLSATDRDAAVARCERELRDHGSSWNLLVAVAGLYAGWATTARAAGEEGAAAVLVEVMCMVNLADDAEEIARLAERGEEARSALGWALADADPTRACVSRRPRGCSSSKRKLPPITSSRSLRASSREITPPGSLACSWGMNPLGATSPSQTGAWPCWVACRPDERRFP